MKIEKDGEKVLDFDMDRLEREYDYESDSSQIIRATGAILNENIEAVKEWATMLNPWDLFENPFLE
jgi:hypothetical protein